MPAATWRMRRAATARHWPRAGKVSRDNQMPLQALYNEKAGSDLLQHVEHIARTQIVSIASTQDAKTIAAQLSRVA